MLKEFWVYLQKLTGAKTTKKPHPISVRKKMETLTLWVYFKGKDFTSTAIIPF